MNVFMQRGVITIRSVLVRASYFIGGARVDNQCFMSSCSGDCRCDKSMFRDSAVCSGSKCIMSDWSVADGGLYSLVICVACPRMIALVPKR